jgi:hypothetical protein
LEGYVVQDLVDLVDKAIFEACKRTGIEAKFANEDALIDWHVTGMIPVRMPLIHEQIQFLELGYYWILIESGTHLASYLMSTRRSFPGDKLTSA